MQRCIISKCLQQKDWTINSSQPTYTELFTSFFQLIIYIIPHRHLFLYNIETDSWD